MRNALIRALESVARTEPRLVLLTGDLGFKIFDVFRAEFPGRFINVGVAEANLIGCAAGLALGGMRPVAYSIAPFATLRCLEQIRNDVCYQNLPVTIVGVGGGYSYGHNGPTHHALEDIAIMRVLPNMTVVCPGDPAETEMAVAQAASYGRPLYLRIGRAGDARVHQTAPRFRIGQAITVQEGSDCAIVSTGGILPVAMAAADLLQAAGIGCRVVSMHTVKPLDDACLRACSRETAAIFTLEEHSRIGGLGSAIAEWAVANEQPSPRFSFAAEDCFASLSGSQTYFRGRNGLTADRIAELIAAKLKEPSRC